MSWMNHLTAIFLFLSSFSVFSQSIKSIEVAPFMGSDILLPDVDYPFSAFGIQAKYIKQSSGDKDWQHYYNLPRMGQEILYANYSRNGYSISSNTFVEFDFLQSLKHQLFISPAIGLVYASETFSTLPDYPLISSPVSISFKVEFGYRYSLSSKWKISTAFMVSHFSNGNTSTPNYGLNMKALKLGLNYGFGEESATNYTPYEKSSYRRFFGQVSMGSGVKSNADERYGFLNGYLNGGLSFHPFHRIVGGINFFTDRTFTSASDERIGLTLGYQIIIGKIRFSVQPGWYLKEYDGDYRYYQVTLQYQISRLLFLQSSLRTTEDFFAEDLAFGLGLEI